MKEKKRLFEVIIFNTKTGEVRQHLHGLTVKGLFRLVKVEDDEIVSIFEKSA